MPEPSRQFTHRLCQQWGNARLGPARPRPGLHPAPRLRPGTRHGGRRRAMLPLPPRPRRPAGRAPDDEAGSRAGSGAGHAVSRARGCDGHLQRHGPATDSSNRRFQRDWPARSIAAPASTCRPPRLRLLWEAADLLLTGQRGLAPPALRQAGFSLRLPGLPGCSGQICCTHPTPVAASRLVRIAIRLIEPTQP